MAPLRVLVACEFSGVVRRAFSLRGHDAWSCDLLPHEDNAEPGGCIQHFRMDVRHLLNEGWDLMIAHPPCTDLASSGARWWHLKGVRQGAALAFVQALMDAPIPRICIENPVGVISTRIRKPDQIVQPWMFGHGETKTTCLWLKDLPALTPTSVVEGRYARVHRESPSPERWKNRSRTYQGIANAMATQWGCN